ncbi:MAG: uL15 family ribosomal protein [Thermoplasmataceae archaeon]
MVRTRTKKQRGGHYGRGMKSGRGKGKRGGSGNAGLHKHHWVRTLINDPLHFGGKGFTSHHPVKVEVPLTLSELSNILPNLEKKGFAKKEGKIYQIDLVSAGYDKLLGSGEFREKSLIKVNKATEKSINKLSAQGSTVEVNGGNKKE